MLADSRRVRRRGVAKEGVAVTTQGCSILLLSHWTRSLLGWTTWPQARQSHPYRSSQSREQ